VRHLERTQRRLLFWLADNPKTVWDLCEELMGKPSATEGDRSIMRARLRRLQTRGLVSFTFVDDKFRKSKSWSITESGKAELFACSRKYEKMLTQSQLLRSLLTPSDVQDLLERHGISPRLAREALMKLERRGLVEAKPVNNSMTWLLTDKGRAKLIAEFARNAAI